MDMDIDKPPSGPKEGIWIRTIGGACPCQADGTIDGCPFYFRARHGSWSLTVTLADTDPVLPNKDHTVYYASGADPYDGYMPVTKAAAIIFKHAMRWAHQKSKKRIEEIESRAKENRNE